MRRALVAFARICVAFFTMTVASQFMTADAITRESGTKKMCVLCELSYDSAGHVCTIQCGVVTCRVCPPNRGAPRLFMCIDHENAAPPLCMNGEVSVIK